MSENKSVSLEKPENPEQKIYEEIWNFLEKNRYASRELKEAWIIFIQGYKELEDGRVGEIVQKFREIDQKHFPISKLRELVEKRKETAKIIEEYLQFIKGLGMTEEDERKLSLITEGKKGKLIILSDGEIISEGIEAPSKENLTSGLSFLLKFMKVTIKKANIKGKKCEFAFREEGQE